MSFSGYIRTCIKEGTQISRFNVTWGGWLSSIGQMFFYVLLTYGFHMPYENFAIRLTASLLALFSIVFVRIDSPVARKYFPLYWHFSLIFNLPFLFTLFLLKNNFHELWLYWEIFMIFVLIAFVPNWLMLLFDLLAGVLAAFVFSLLTTPAIRLNPDFDIPAYSTVLFFTVVAGYLFSYSNRKGQLAMEKNSALQALAGSIAHEMRNPLGQVKLNLEIIEQQLPVRRHDVAFPQCKTSDDLFNVLDSLYQHVAWCQIAVKRGSQIISMILDQVKEKPVDKGSFAYASASVMTRKAINEYGFETGEERDKLIVDDTHDFMFRINETMYVFVLFNLIKNALYFLESRPEARIYVTLEKGRDYNSVKVKDTGPGISRENVEKLFDPYFTASRKGGTGLGLSYCQRVMHAFDGDITCDSVEGQYTEFVLTFPVVTQGELLKSRERFIAENRALFDKKRILVVDDKEHDRKVVRDALQPFAVVLDEAGDGKSALGKLETAHFDLVIMNLSMPVLNGYEATEMIRIGKAGEEFSTIPIVAYTEQPYGVVQGVVKKAGMQDVMTKPCSDYDIIRTIAAVFNEDQSIALHRLQGRKILVADDSAINRTVIVRLLERYGIEVEEALNGKDALRKSETGMFDLVLMDIGMPVVDGLQATRQLRQSKNPEVSTIPVIGFSGESDEEMIKTALQAGMNDYLVKPVDMRQLLQKITAYL